MKSVSACRLSHWRPGGQDRADPREVDIHAVVVVLLGYLLQDAQLVVADPLDGEVPVAVQALAGRVRDGLVPGVDEPVGVVVLHGQARHPATHVVVRAVDAVGEERFQPAAARLIEEGLDGIEPGLLPLAVWRRLDERQYLAGPVGLVALAEAPPDAIDARLRVVDELEERLLHLLYVDAGQVHDGGEGVEVHDDAAIPLDGRDVLGRQTGCHGKPPRFTGRQGPALGTGCSDMLKRRTCEEP